MFSHVRLFVTPMEPTRLLCPWNFQARILEWVAISYSKVLFQSQGSNLHLPHWQADALPLHQLGNPFDGWCSGKESTFQCRRCKRHGFHHWIRNISWRKKWHTTSVSLPGKSHQQRSLVDYNPWGLERGRCNYACMHSRYTWGSGKVCEPDRSGFLWLRQFAKGDESRGSLWTLVFDRCSDIIFSLVSLLSLSLFSC